MPAARMSKRQRHQQLDIEKRKATRRIQKKQQAEASSSSSNSASTIITSEMIEESSLRSSIDRFRSLLPPKVKTTPTCPPRFSRVSPHVLPYATKNCRLPWMETDVNNKDSHFRVNGGQGDLKESPALTNELIRFAEFVMLMDEEVNARCQVVQDLEDALQVNAKWVSSGLSLRQFGSFPAGLSTFLSDIDISIITPDKHKRTFDEMRQFKSNSPDAECVVLSDDEDDDDSMNDCGGLDIHISDEIARINDSIDDSSVSYNSIHRQKQLDMLQDICSFVRSFSWLEQIEFRKRAKVPILNLMHRNKIEVDISVGVAEADTSELVDKLRRVKPYEQVFLVLSSFLKSFLHQLGLDKPFVGGIGSYKLYVMIGYMINVIQEYQKKKSSGSGPASSVTPTEDVLYSDCGTDEGMCLLAFFNYFGQPKNLNSDTVLRVRGAEASFDKTSLVTLCQSFFARAYRILLVAVAEGTSRAFQKFSKSSRAPATVSLLSPLLLNVEELISTRNKRAGVCRDLQRAVEKDAVGRDVLVELQQWQSRIQAPSALVDARVQIGDVRRVDPLLWERLRAFSSSREVLEFMMRGERRRRVQRAGERRREAMASQVQERLREEWLPASKRRRVAVKAKKPIVKVTSSTTSGSKKKNVKNNTVITNKIHTTNSTINDTTTAKKKSGDKRKSVKGGRAASYKTKGNNNNNKKKGKRK